MSARTGPAAVLGAGSWGTALANLLAGRGLDVRLWSHSPEVAEGINRDRENRVYLEGVALEDRVRATTELAAALEDAAAVVCATPSHVTREVLERARPLIAADALLVNAAKGIEVDTLLTLSRVMRSVLPQVTPVTLSGPSFAREVAQGHPTAVVAASDVPQAAERVQTLFSTARFRVYTNDDLTGVELAGSLKNVIALAAGVVEGLEYGYNTRAALLTRALAEITRLGVAMGARARTFAGLAGMGDLILTCTGALSRNRAVGLELARGRPLADVLRGMRMVAEGVNTTKAALRLAERHDVEVPITQEVHAFLFEGKSPDQAVEDLMVRKLKPEHWGIRDA